MLSACMLTTVAEPGQSFIQLLLGELLGQRKQGCARSRNQIDLLGKLHSRIVLNYSDGLVHATRDVKRVPS